MNKKEFQKIIRKARKKLKTDYERLGACCALYYANDRSYKVSDVFDDFMAPRTLRSGALLRGFERNVAYWLGNLDKDNLDRRLYWLEFFEVMAIETNLYKEL